MFHLVSALTLLAVAHGSVSDALTLADFPLVPVCGCSLTQRDSKQLSAEAPSVPRRLADQHETLVVSAGTTVAAGSVLTLRSAYITPGSGFSAPAFIVQGKLVLSDCSVENFESEMFSVTGEVFVSNTNFRNNREAVFTVSNAASVRLVGVVVDSQKGTFLAYQGSGQMTISIEDSTFSSGVQSGGEGVIQILAYGGSGNVSISGCTFISNSLRLLLIDIRSTAVSVRNSYFISNAETLLTVFQSGGSTIVQSCDFFGNSSPLLSVFALRGKLSASDLFVFSHFSAVFFRVENNGSSGDCSAVFSEVAIKESVNYFDVSFSAILSVSGCTVYARNFVLERAILFARLGSSQVALFLVQQGALHLSNSTAANSGTTGVLLIGYLSTITIAHCSFTNSTILQSIYFAMMMGDLAAEEVQIADLRGVNYANNFGLGAVYFGTSQSRVAIKGLTVLHGGDFWSTAIMAPRFSTFTVRNVVLTNVSMSVGISTVSSSGEISSFKAFGTFISSFVYQTVSSSNLTITETEIINCSFGPKTIGIFSLCTKSRVILSFLTVANTTLNYIAKAKDSYLELHSINASTCTFHHLLKDIINSEVLVSSLQFSNSSGGLVDAWNCNVTLADSRIEAVASRNFLIRASATTMQLRNVTMARVTVGMALAYLQEGSAASLSGLQVSYLLPQQDQGLVVNGGNLTISDSVFSYFVGSLIQATDASVVINSVRFSNGFNFIESRISRIAYGGVLGCVDCVSVSIDNFTVRNVSTVFGGAISIQSSGTKGTVVVRRSTFESCSAVVGGALYIRKVNFDIDGCLFRHNSASESGGAIDLSVPANFTKSLRSLVFLENSAHEGGAVKWREAQGVMWNVTAANNSAQYGPNFASYGIELSSRLTAFSNLTASGYPLHLVYELLDHYGQRVTTAHEEVLVLHGSDSIAFPGYTTVVRSRGLFNFTVPIVLAPPGSTQLLEAHIDIKGSEVVVDKRLVTFRKCVPGEVSQTDRCAYCFSGNVSFHPESGECSQCPYHAFCFGGTNMTIDPHYWRSSNDSLVLVECPLPGTCLGGNNNSCAFGFTGKLCNECIDGYYRYQMTMCEKCDKAVALYAQFVPVAAVIALFTLLVMKCSASETRLFTLKTALSHAQLLSALSPLKAALPASFLSFLHGLSYFSSLFITDLPASCIGVGNEPAVRAAVASCLLPFISVLTFSIVAVSRSKQAVICYTSFLLFVPSIAIQSIFPLLACIRSDDGRQWLFTNMSQECWNLDHWRLIYALFLPSIAISVLAPSLLVASMFFHRSSQLLNLFPMWTCGYQWELWDVVQSVLKHSLQILMYSGLGFSRVGQFSSGLISLYALCFVNVFFVAKVYRGKEFFWLAECSYLIVTMCYSMAGVYVFKETGYSGSGVTFSIAFELLNCGFFLYCAYLLLCDFKTSTFVKVQIEAVKPASCPLPNESFGELIVPNNSQLTDAPTRIMSEMRLNST